MLTQDPVKIPDMNGKIRSIEKNGTQYIQYLVSRRYDSGKKHNVPTWANIGRRCERMPGLMFPNDNYEKYFITREGEEHMNENMTPEEEAFAQNNRTYGLYAPFFEALYHEFRQQTRKRPDELLNKYKTECLNRVLRPLKEMMKDEEYAEMLELAECSDGECGMSSSDVMILLTQYKSALNKYRRMNH